MEASATASQAKNFLASAGLRALTLSAEILDSFAVSGLAIGGTGTATGTASLPVEIDLPANEPASFVGFDVVLVSGIIPIVQSRELSLCQKRNFETRSV